MKLDFTACAFTMLKNCAIRKKSLFIYRFCDYMPNNCAGFTIAKFSNLNLSKTTDFLNKFNF
jgi:hypothetical protein